MQILFSQSSQLSQSTRYIVLFAIACAIFPAVANAQDNPDVITEDAEKKLKGVEAPPENNDGWTYDLTLGANISFNHNRKVVGSVDGLTMQIGGLLKGSLNLISGTHEWQNDLVVEHGQTKTPQIDSFVKSTDNLELRSLYTWRITPWFGPFARFKLQTQILKGYDIGA